MKKKSINFLSYLPIGVLAVTLIGGYVTLQVEAKTTKEKVDKVDDKVDKVEIKVEAAKEKADKVETKQEAIKENTEQIQKKTDKIEEKIDQIVAILLEEKSKGVKK